MKTSGSVSRPALRPPDLCRVEEIPLEGARLRRASTRLVATRVRDHPFHYRVSGGAEPHWVSLYPYFDCDCADFIHHDVVCSHILACLLELAHPFVVQQARRALADPRGPTTRDHHE